MAEETKIIRLVIDSSKAVDGGRAAQRALEQIERSTFSLDSAMARMEQSLGRVGGMIKAHLALVLAEMAARLVEMAKAAAEAVGGLDELAEQLGLTTRGLQALQFSGVQNGLKLEQLETGAAKFSQKIGEAANGSKEMIEALDGLGIKILDADKALRPTEDVMTDVARAILAIEDPARRAAASVDFFGKAGTRFQPVLQDIAKGFGFMGEEARKGGALVDDHVVKRLDQLSDALERSKLRSRAFFAEMAVAVLDMADKYVDAYKRMLAQQATRSSGGGYQWERDFQSWMDNAVSNMAGVGAGVVEVFRGAAAQIPKLFIDAFNDILRSAEDLLNKLAKNVSALLPGLPSQISLGQIPGGGASLTDYLGGVGQKAEAARADTQAYFARQRSSFGQASDGTAWSVVNDGLPAQNGPRPGLSNPPAKAGGGNSEDSVDKLKRQTELALEAAQALADVSTQGSRAVADLELHFKAVKEVQDAYASSAHKAGISVEELTKRIEDQQRATERAKGLKDFNIETSSLQRANELLEAENRLIDQSTETRALQIAQIKLRQELELKGIAGTTEAERAAIAARGEAITQNERLKGQAEELKRANELWTEPLKTALSSIQSTAADAFATMLESGKLSFQLLGDVVKKTVIRMIAEFAALATIRPMLGALMGGLTGIGLVSPATASSLGYGSSLSGSSISLPSPGVTGSSSLWNGLGLGGVGDWLNTPVTGPYAGISPAAMQGVPTLSPSMWSPSTWGITPLQGIGAAAGIGAGIYQLATSKSTAGTIGGIGSMIGAGISLIPGMAPIGMGISLLSSILPGLFGGDAPKLPPLAGASINFNAGASGYGTSNYSQNGGASLAGQYGGITGTLDALFKATGARLDPALATGGAIWNNQREGTTSTYALHPWLGSVQLSEGSGDQSAAIDRMIAKVFYMTATTPGALTGMSPTLSTALGNKEPTSTVGVQALLDMVKTYDALGKVLPAAKDALDAIDKKFADLTSTAMEYGLALAPIQAEQKKVTARYAQDFIDGMLDPLAVQMRALDDERKASLASAEYIRDNVKDVYVDMARIAEYYTRKEADLKAQFYGQSLTQLEDAIRRLSLGDLANLSPTTMLTGVQAAYQATVAQARSGDSSAIARVAAEGTTLAQAGQTYYASGPDYESLKQQILDDLRTIQSQVQGGGSGTTGTALNDNNGATQAALSQVAQLQSVVSEQSRQIALLMTKLTETNDLLLRRVANG